MITKDLIKSWKNTEKVIDFCPANEAQINNFEKNVCKLPTCLVPATYGSD